MLTDLHLKHNMLFWRLEAEWLVIVSNCVYHLPSSIGGLITTTVMQKHSRSSAFLIQHTVF